MDAVITLQKCPSRELGDSLGIGYIESSFYIRKGEVTVGHLHVNRMLDATPFVEWAEIYPPFQGQHLFRPALYALFREYPGTDELYLDASESHLAMYDHMGAQRIEYDDIREVWQYVLPKSMLMNPKEESANAEN